MIARIWRGIIRATDSKEYLQYLRGQIAPVYQSAEGNRGVSILHNTQGEFASILLLSFWESREAMDRFSDPQFQSESSRENRNFLLARESTAAVYEVFTFKEIKR